jgi:predicted DNA-binding transcriptional regulator
VVGIVSSEEKRKVEELRKQILKQIEEIEAKIKELKEGRKRV